MYKLFYIISNTYQNTNKDKHSPPPLVVWGLFTFAIAATIGFFYTIYKQILFYDGKVSIISKPVLFSVTALSGALAYYLFYYKEKYIVIFEKYGQNNLYSKPIVKVLAFFILIFIMLSPIILAAIIRFWRFGNI